MSQNWSERVRFTTEMATDASPASVTAHRLGDRLVRLTPDWLYSPEWLAGTVAELNFAKGKMARTSQNKVKALISGLGIGDAVATSDVIYEIRSLQDGERYPQGAYVGLRLGHSQE